MNEMLLDRIGNVPVPAGYQVVSSEVEFLQRATEDVPMLVRGTRLCQWAEDFWHGRRIPYRELHSPLQSLQALVPHLDETDAQAICAVLPAELLPKLHKLTLTGLLQAIFPNVVWQKRPSKTHAAAWLLWLYENQPDKVYEPLLAEQGHLWQRDVDDATHNIYDATNAQAARQWLDIWLGLTPDLLLEELGIFPVELPEKLQKHAATVWRDEVITHHGSLFPELKERSILPDLKLLAAQETIKYLEHHPKNLTKTLRDELSPYLTQDEQNRLLNLLPPPMPDKLPDEPEAILSWFRQQYLPARQWQTVYGSDADRQMVSTAAEQFARWYLDQYPRALNGSYLHKHLSFARAAASQKQDSYVTLLIVLDGLHLPDSVQLMAELQRQTDRLTIWENGMAFAPLPTITEVCKPALFAGVSPDLAQQVPTIGTVLPENNSPMRELDKALVGSTYLWRIMEPDHTYHRKNSSEALRHEIEGQLTTIAKKIGEIVKNVPAEIPLRLVLTSDHGRLLAKATRTLSVPVGMQSQGRAALGVSGQDFDEQGFVITGKLAYLHAGRFGLLQDAAVAFSEGAFFTNDGKTGSEWYPHGGLYPEEVIVPWIELLRDMALPEVSAKISGSGRAGQSGELVIHLRNLSDIPITIISFALLANGHQSSQQLKESVSPYTEQTFSLVWSPWPGKGEVGNVTAKLSLQLPNSLAFVVTVEKPQLESIEMYQRDNILGDLDL